MTNWLWPTRGLLPLIIFLHHHQQQRLGALHLAVILLASTALMRQAVAGATVYPVTSLEGDDRPLSNVSTSSQLLSHSPLSITVTASSAGDDYLLTSTLAAGTAARRLTSYENGKYASHTTESTGKDDGVQLLSSLSGTRGSRQRPALSTVTHHPHSPHPSSRGNNKSHHHQHQQQRNKKHHGSSHSSTNVWKTVTQQQPVSRIASHGVYHGDEADGKGELAEFTGVAWLSLQGVHVCLVTASFFVNTLALVAAHGYAVRLSPCLQLLTSLGLAHCLAMCGVAALYFRPSSCQRQVHAGLVMAAHNATALTLAVWAVLQAAATLAPERCMRIARIRPIWVSVCSIWLLSLLAGHAHFLLAACPSLNGAYHNNDVTGTSQFYCQQAHDKSILPLLASLAIYAVAVTVGISAYAAATCRLRKPLIAVQGEGRCYRPPSSTNSREPLTLSASLEENETAEPANDKNHKQSTDQQQQQPGVVNTFMSSTNVVTGVILLVFYALAWGPHLAAKFYQVLLYTKTSQGQGMEEEGYWVVLQGTLLAPLCFCLVCPLLCGVRVAGMDIAYLRLYHAWRARAASLGHALRRATSSPFAPTSGHSPTPIERDPITAPLQAIESIC
jgi:hypothetical protein